MKRIAKYFGLLRLLKITVEHLDDSDTDCICAPWTVSKNLQK